MMVNLVLLDTTVVAIDTVTLFGNVEVLYMLFSKSLNAHTVYKVAQRSECLEIPFTKAA